MSTFIIKALPVTAVQYNGLKDHADQIKDWVNGGKEPKDQRDATESNQIDLDLGMMVVEPGDWVVKGVDGRFGACSAEVFEDMYMRLGDE